MTTTLYTRTVVTLLSLSAALAQESPTPGLSAPSEESAALSISPAGSAKPSAAPQQTPSISPARNVRISFVPPPLEGTISLGIYDKSGKLVRVLHQQASLSEFTIGADALVTHWDGKDDDGQDLPAGKYHARGYLVGSLKVEDVGDSSSPPAQLDANAKVKVRLARNPLRKEKRPVIELGLGSDEDGSYLKTGDELPLFIVTETPNLTRGWITAKNEDVLDVWQDDGAKLHQFRVSNLDQMMAFDCGEVELK